MFLLYSLTIQLHDACLATYWTFGDFRGGQTAGPIVLLSLVYRRLVAYPLRQKRIIQRTTTSRGQVKTDWGGSVALVPGFGLSYHYSGRRHGQPSTASDSTKYTRITNPRFDDCETKTSGEHRQGPVFNARDNATYNGWARLTSAFLCPSRTGVSGRRHNYLLER